MRKYLGTESRRRYYENNKEIIKQKLRDRYATDEEYRNSVNNRRKSLYQKRKIERQQANEKMI